LLLSAVEQRVLGPVGFRSRSTGVEITSGELFCVEVAGAKELNLTQMEYNHYGRR